MEALFELVWSMTKTASIVILVVMAVTRIVLKNAPKKYAYVLWAVVLLRLLCPFAVETPFSPLTAVRVVQDPQADSAPQVEVEPAAEPAYTAASTAEYSFEPAGMSVGEFIAQNRRAIAVGVWLLGWLGLLGYSALSLLRLRRKLVEAVPMAGENRVFLAGHIPSPFVLGVFRPKIYLPSGLAENELEYILLHERTHIRRLDYLTRALAWLAVSLHWFNPLVWLAFRMAGQDMEQSCDEAVLGRMGRDVRGDYSQSLLRLSVKGLSAGPLAFGGGNLRARIENVLDYKKPALWTGAAALIVVLCVGGATATNQEGIHIDPNSITSVTMFNASSNTLTERNGRVYTPADRKKDLQAPANAQEITREKGAQLVRLINSYGKKVKYRGEFQLNGPEHHFVRFDCADGSFYLMDYWYYNGFNFNPFTLPQGEDDYTTLVTYCDAEGNVQTTWELEHAFEAAYREWCSPSPPVQRGALVRSKATVDGLDGSLIFSMYTREKNVDIEGTLDGVKLQPERSSWSPEPFPWYPGMGFEYPCGWLSLVRWEPGYSRQAKAGRYDGSATRQFGIYAGWTDDSRTSISISTQPRVINNSREYHGFWHFTVELATGTVTGMEAHVPYYNAYAIGSEPIVMHPVSISDEEAVEMARTAAKVIGAAETFYQANGQS